MPTAATHITVVERVAATNAALSKLLGEPNADPDSEAGTRMRYAKLGSMGPDIFYALADYGGDLQDLENFLVKVAGSFQAIGELMGKVNRYVSGLESEITLGISDSLKQTFSLITGSFTEGILALLVGPTGLNFWPVFEAARQRDKPREEWFWADYLHYIKTGTFAQQLIANARATGNPHLLAYAYGYLTHYVTDVVGHPYVNQVVQAPWRLYWQRHHVVENYIDAYVWDRWHVATPPPAPPSTEEQPLDTLVATPNTMGKGAPLTFARLNDHVNIGSASLGDPVDALVGAVAEKINKGLFDIGVAEDITPVAPADADFQAWCKLLAGTMRQVYDTDGDHRVPSNLASNIPGVPARPDGYPTPDDVAGAYGVYRLVLRMGTEESIAEPQAPDLLGDISKAAQKLLQDLADNLGSLPPPPSINHHGSFSWGGLWDAIKKIAAWVAETMVAIGKTVFEALVDAIKLALGVVSDFIKYILYLLNKALFSLYSVFRDVLVHAGYAIPFTADLAADLGGGHSAETLWRSPGNLRAFYPVEEVAMERDKVFSNYSPVVPPLEQAQSQAGHGAVFFEHPSLPITAPYTPSGDTLLTPDIFLDPDLGPDDMFRAEGPLTELNGQPLSANSKVLTNKNFGGAIANSIKGIKLAEAGFPKPALLPDYNLDGDRAYAWPCWDVMDPEPNNNPSPQPTTATPLRPEATNDNTTTREALVNAIAVAN